MKITQNKILARIIAEALASYLYRRSREFQDRIDAEKDRLRRDEPNKVKSYDHKDWRWANEEIIFLHGSLSEVDDLTSELLTFMERVGLSD